MKMSQLDDEALLAELDRRYGSLSVASFADPDIRALMLPILRGDFSLLESYSLSARRRRWRVR